MGRLEVCDIPDPIRDVPPAVGGSVLCHYISSFQGQPLQPLQANFDFFVSICLSHGERVPWTVFRPTNDAFVSWSVCAGRLSLRRRTGQAEKQKDNGRCSSRHSPALMRALVSLRYCIWSGHATDGRSRGSPERPPEPHR